MNYFILSLFVLAISFSCNQKDISSLEFYYVPWSIHREGGINEAELLNLNDKLISYYCSNNNKFVNEFRGLFQINKFKLKPMINSIEPFMLIKMNLKNGKTEKLLIGQKIYFMYQNKTYLDNSGLKSWLKRNIPVATFPKGIRSYQECKKE